MPEIGVIPYPNIFGGWRFRHTDALQSGDGVTKRPRQHGDPHSPLTHLRLYGPAGTGEHPPRLRKPVQHPGDIRKVGLCRIHQNKPNGGRVALRDVGDFRRAIQRIWNAHQTALNNIGFGKGNDAKGNVGIAA